MTNESWSQSPPIIKLVFHFIGVFSAVSLLLILLKVVPGFLRGDMNVVRDFLAAYPGIEPFVIFIFPIVLIIGLAWIFQLFLKPKHSDKHEL